MTYRVLAAASLMIMFAFMSLSAVEANGSKQDLDKRIDALLAPWDRPDAPGVAALVQRDGKDTYHRCLGLANMELSVPISPETCFDFASVSKHLTAFGILLLVQEGKMSLDDPIRRYLPELPSCAEPILVPNQA